MKFAKKDFSEYWKIIKIPSYVLIGWSLIALIISIASFSMYITIFSPWSNWILTIAVFSFIGWTAIKDHKETIKVASWAGALTGLITGLIGAVFGIIMFYLVPEVIQAAVAQAGVNAEAVQSYMKIGIYIGLITGPLVSALIGALISAIAALIAKKIK